jgi:hypothetical protein
MVKAETLAETTKPPRKRTKKERAVDEKTPPLPKLLSDANSVESTTSATKPPSKSKWLEPYEPPPVVNQSTVLTFGFLIFGLAVLWPPLILLVAYIVSKLIPYSFRVNDDAAQRRLLCHDFHTDTEATPDSFRNIPNHIGYEEAYWVNQRYVYLERSCDMPVCANVAAAHACRSPSTVY